MLLTELLGNMNDKILIIFLKVILPLIKAVVAEWLRRLTRNQILSGSVGSNPTSCDIFLKSYVVKLINLHIAK